jgi:hypothetical protein
VAPSSRSNFGSESGLNAAEDTTSNQEWRYRRSYGSRRPHSCTPCWSTIDRWYPA